MALNKKRLSNSVSANPAAETAVVETEAPRRVRGRGAQEPATAKEPAPAQTNGDLTAIQTALTAIVNSIAELAKKLTDETARLDGRVDELSAKLDAAISDEVEDAISDDEVDEEEDDEYGPDDIDAEKVLEALKGFETDEQKEILTTAMSNSGIKRINPSVIKRDPNAAYAVAEVLCSEDYEVDVEDLVK